LTKGDCETGGSRWIKNHELLDTAEDLILLELEDLMLMADHMIDGSCPGTWQVPDHLAFSDMKLREH
jgi:hypothetical protein